MQEYLTPAAALPADGTAGTLVGRAWVPGAVPGRAWSRFARAACTI